MPRILVTSPVLFHAAGPYADVLAGAGHELVYPSGSPLKQSVAERRADLAGIDAVLAGVESYTLEILAGSKLRAIARVGVGYDAIDVPAATQRGIVVAITPGTNENSVAEQALALLFALFRDVAARDAEIRAGRWRRDPVRRLAGNTLGLVGLGRIGRALVPRAHGLGLRVIASDPFADRDFAAQHDVEMCAIDDLFARSDIVSLHMPCTVETSDLINRRTLGLMKPSAVLINTARGGLIDEVALAEALTQGTIAGAGLDVFKEEPLPADHPLLRLPNVVVAPHMGGIDQAAIDAMGKLGADCLVNLHAGRWPTDCVVNETLRSGWRW
ncbi:MAG TPA: phosphoglycerate dehydrogenase [Pirellulales bacterium]|jgi:phosphoglycerate dehydrogenase-like enzyme|nr:phosphoglycerate dehydrogenase [Pirellulales bacterium]